jgi:hypothetical protein
MKFSRLLHPDALTIIVAILLGISLASGWTFNPAGFLTPIVIRRSSHPRLYWFGVAVLAIFVVGSWLVPH